MNKMDWVGYLIVAVYIAIAFWAVLMGIDKMAKVIIGNYLAGITCFAFGNLINLCVNWLMSSSTSSFLGISYTKYASFLSSGQLTFILLMFAGLTRLIYKCGQFQVSFNTRTSTEKLYFVLLIPITVLSFVIGPYIALKADGIQALNFIENSVIQTFGFAYSFIKNIPFWMFLNGIVFIIISCKINFKISFSAKATKLPEGM